MNAKTDRHIVMMTYAGGFQDASDIELCIIYQE